VATVWRAFDLVTDQQVAVKLLKDVLDPEDAARIQQEVSIVARLDHPNIIRFLDQGVTELGQRYVVMELLEGQTLRQRLVDQTALELDEALEILLQVYGALYEAHSHRVVHRDMKPENVFLLAPDGRKIKLLDFGMAKIMGHSVPSLTWVGRLFGTPQYMAPERVQGEETRPSGDIYSTAVMAFEMLTGRRPFDGETVEETMKRHLTADRPTLSEFCPDLTFPEELDRILVAALNEEREQRPTAEEVIKVLLELKGEPTEAPPEETENQ
jgi:serine/threonine-protein kinase